MIETVERLEPTFGGINLEDIKSPECFEIEETLERELDIPVFHDDQHGTAIVVTAALITPAAADSELMIYSENVAVDTVSVPKNEKKTLAAGGLSGYNQRQIQVGGDVWANIAGATGAELEVGYALVANLLYGGTANIRCRVTGAAEEPVYSNTVTVQITDETPVSAPAQAPKAPTVISEAEPVGEPVIIPPQTAAEETPAPDAAPAADPRRGQVHPLLDARTGHRPFALRLDRPDRPTRAALPSDPGYGGQRLHRTAVQQFVRHLRHGERHDQSPQVTDSL